MEKQKCSFSGCHCDAEYILSHKWDNNVTHVCSTHAPEWVTDPNWVNPLEVKLGRKIPIFYTVNPICNANS